MARKAGKGQPPRPVQEIDAEIGALEKELEDARGSECEVYTRIVGYYRSVRNWNKGKREEYGERKEFSAEAALTGAACRCGNATAQGAFPAGQEEASA